MKKNIKKKLNEIIRKDIAEMESYIPVASVWDLARKYGQDIQDIVKLDAGESQLGFSPKVLKALTSDGAYNFYPDPEYKELRQALARYTNAAVENIMVSSGADELLDLIFRLILEAGDQVINCPPTFGMYPVLTKLNKGQILSVSRNEDFSFNIADIKKAINEKVKCIVVCTPNNPTGTVTTEQEIVSLLETGKLVVVDEAYYEFSGKTVASLVAKYPNLIVIRTLSKWAGLAGLRLGYGIMDPFFVQQLFKIKPPYNVNLAANIAGLAALEDTRWSKKTIETIVSQRERLSKSIGSLIGFKVYPSEANMLFIKMKNDISKLKNFLEKKKIAVRYYESFSAVRLSIGTQEQNELVLSAFKEFSTQQIDSVLFDMDGVLVDVHNSYRLVIQKTVESVLESKYGKKVSVSQSDIEAIKQIPGFNNDWDVSYALISLLAKDVQQNTFKKFAVKVGTNAKKSTEYQQIKDIFQTYYLGSELFAEVYKRTSPFTCKQSLIANEFLLVDVNILRDLSKKYTLGVATSRPRFEALYTLKKTGIVPNFIDESNVIAQEDSLREKPFPDPLFAAQTCVSAKSPVYVGDTVNDLLAARAADMPCIFVGKNQDADSQIATTNEIKNILL